MNRAEKGEFEELSLGSRAQVMHLIIHGKIDEAMEIIAGRKKEEGLEEIRWRIIEIKCLNKRGENEKVITIASTIKKKIEELVDQGDEAKRIWIDTLTEQVRALQRLGQLDKSLKKIGEGIKLVEELESTGEKEVELRDRERKADLLDSKGGVYNWKGELSQALVYYEESLEIREKLENKPEVAKSLNNIGVIYHQKGELGQALGYYKKSLVIKKELGNRQEIAKSLNNIGVIYHNKGGLDKALDYYEKSLAIKEQLGNKRLMANSLNNIGAIYHRKGELNRALRKFRGSLAMREAIGNKLDIAKSLNYIGDLYHEMGSLEQALDFFKQSMVLSEETGNKLGVVYSLFGLIDVNLELNEIRQAKVLLGDLQLINEQKENKQVELRSRLAEALILKNSKRRKNLAKADEMLTKIVEDTEEEIIDHQLAVKALIALSELLLDELNSTGEEEILGEVEEKVNKLIKIAKEQQSYTLMTESYWLKAQLALVRLDLRETRDLLIQAQLTAEERGLERLARKISGEHDQLLEQLDQWEELIANDASITERVKIANLEELVGWMARKREIIIDEKEDEPIMIMLVSESGLPIYCKQFDETRELQHMLISGFLSSINSFIQEAFNAPGVIRRIMHDEYTLSFNLIEPILFCYVYEGPSYTAMKKLEKLINDVHESKFWSALEVVGKMGLGLKLREKEQMENVIGQIFHSN